MISSTFLRIGLLVVHLAASFIDCRAEAVSALASSTRTFPPGSTVVSPVSHSDGRVVGDTVVVSANALHLRVNNSVGVTADHSASNTSALVSAVEDDLSMISNRSSSSMNAALQDDSLNEFEVSSLKLSSSDQKSLYGTGTALLPPIYNPPLAYQPPPVFDKYVPYGPSVYTRAKLGYGSSFYNGREAELRCQFPFNLRLNSNFVWNKVSDNLVHYLDSYRVVERSYDHISSLYIRYVLPKDFGIYSCAVTGSFYPGHQQPITYYQEVHFFPPNNYPVVTAYKKYK